MPKLYQVLLIEDDSMIARTLKMSLSFKGFEVSVSETIENGAKAFKSQTFDLLLLDVNLPDGNGLEFCREIRLKNTVIPILMLTAKTDEASAVKSFECGADDYIRKPFGAQELVARMLRLLAKKRDDTLTLTFAGLKVEPQSHLAWAKDVPLNLGKREFEILTLLVKRSGEAVTRNEILDALGEDSELYDRTIDSHLSHLRKKLKEAGADHVQIVPIYGVGYRLEAK